MASQARSTARRQLGPTLGSSSWMPLGTTLWSIRASRRSPSSTPSSSSSYVTYTKKNTRDGIFREHTLNPVA